MEAYNVGKRSRAPGCPQSSLHSVRKPQVKPWKLPIAPLPPIRPRVYKVDPANFRDLVQKLTGADDPSHSQQRLHNVAPPPLHLERPVSFGADVPGDLQFHNLSPAKISFSTLNQEVMVEMMDTKHRKTLDGAIMQSGLLDFNFSSPSSHGWFSFHHQLLSPGTLSCLEQSKVL
ncbi:hypothetical protein K2173_015304 [Erythroxylum novogranatense]|uniref:VQ domain-containing protein n=1 Tax=Erythroxylum novogranatense TaxID=1862640 RepID=A0AAV8T1U0_9ROSI|nr:hypothetical protein K2173_015304 [Erythroxylum novogranatense]